MSSPSCQRDCWLQFHIQHREIGKDKEKCQPLYINVLGIPPPPSRHVVESATALSDRTVWTTRTVWHSQLSLGDSSLMRHPNTRIFSYRIDLTLDIRPCLTYIHVQTAPAPTFPSPNPAVEKLLAVVSTYHPCTSCLSAVLINAEKIPWVRAVAEKNSAFPMNNPGSAEWHQRVCWVFYFYFLLFFWVDQATMNSLRGRAGCGYMVINP